MIESWRSNKVRINEIYGKKEKYKGRDEEYW